MLPAGAFAVVLILGGAQIMLPAPAFVEQGRVWAPAREVLQRVGCKVRWQAEGRLLIATYAQLDLAFPEQPPPWPAPANPEAARFARRVGNLLYVPLLALRNFGLAATWEPGARRVVIRDPTVTPTTLAAILNNPAQWLDRTVSLTGDYLGWDAYPFSYATRPGPPVASGDWVLGNEDGAIYCTPEPTAFAAERPGLAPAQPTAPMLTPYGVLGRRLAVEGAVMLAPAGVPYLCYQRVAFVTGREGVSCHLVLDQQGRAPGQTLTWELVIHNPGPRVLPLPATREMMVSVAAPGGGVSVSKQSLPQRTVVADVPAAEERRLRGEWRVPAQALPGTYSITVFLGDTLRSYAGRFEVSPPLGADQS